MYMNYFNIFIQNNKFSMAVFQLIMVTYGNTFNYYLLFVEVFGHLVGGGGVKYFLLSGEGVEVVF